MYRLIGAGTLPSSTAQPPPPAHVSDGDVERSFVSLALSLAPVESRKSSRGAKRRVRGAGGRSCSCSRHRSAAAVREADSCQEGGRDLEAQTDRSWGRGRDDGDEEELDDVDSGVDVEVKVEETVTVEVDRAAFERESYREPRVLWTPTRGPRSRSRSGRGGDGPG